ncbi:MAG TPA: hypothetical protein VKD72_30890 [Gemmataceae bacterium]|nr:hypothetical protein [Gemmataceae bacterium]
MKKGSARGRGKPARESVKSWSRRHVPTRAPATSQLRRPGTDTGDDFDPDEEIARLLAERQGFQLH